VNAVAPPVNAGHERLAAAFARSGERAALMP